jgi:hypothetical protein
MQTPHEEVRRETALDMMREIASFYDNPNGALKLLKGRHTTPITERFLEKEKALFEKRKANGVKSPILILELTLDETSIVSVPGHSLGLPAYQAEMYYRGTA